MHLLRRTHDGVDRASLNAERTADAMILVDYGYRSRTFHAVSGIEWNYRLAEQVGNTRNAFRAAGGASIVVCAAVGNGFCVGSASRVPALGALGLRKQVVDLVGKRFGCEGGHGKNRKEKHDYPSKPAALQIKKAALLERELTCPGIFGPARI
jgi:hypothetical protein